ncbi:MAG: CpaF family protein [Candidatus Dadabacteria bacterium]|nr:MAG: CpaF family protein [Candidatus Dadabacteria bacterium]
MGLLDRVRDRESSEPTGPAKANKLGPRPDNGNSAGLAEPLRPAPSRPGIGAAAPQPAGTRSRLKPQRASSEHLKQLKVKIHSELIERLDLAALGSLEPNQASAEIRSVIAQLLEEGGLPLSREDRRRLEAEITSEVLGFGPLDPLLKDDTVSDILVNSAKQVYVERNGKLELTDITFRDDDHLLQIIDRIVSQVGRRVDTACPMVDARLPDGSRVNAIIPPIALDGPALSIRRFGRDPYHIQHLIAFGSMTREMAEFFEAIVKARLNIIVSGGTGSGKTTLLNCLSSFIPHDERVVTIEDAAELQLQQPHVVRLETRPPNLEGKGEITARDLVRNCLRMRPDRIVVGEVRGGETLDMLQAMNTGHDGSITTLHANSPRDCLSRLEMMILMAGVDLPVQAMRQQISSAVNIIIQQARLRDGTRKVTKVTEITGMEGDTISTQDIFEFVATGIDPHGKVEGYFRTTGIRPKCAPTLAAAGFDLGPNFFAERRL